MVRRVLLLCLIGVLTACGSQGQAAAPTALPTPTPAGTSPEAVHAAWVGAMRDNDRDTLRSLVATMDFQQAFVDDNLKAMQDMIRNQKYGAFDTVDVQALSTEGAAKKGLSVWRFETYDLCYTTTIIREAEVWKVIDWGALPRCPKDVSR